MSQAIYEQVSASQPGQRFMPSGLYRLAGYVMHGRFVRATTTAPLRTLAQAQATTPAPIMRCANCLAYLPAEQDATGHYRPCTTCGYDEAAAPAQVAGDFMTYAAPDTLGRIVALKRHPGQVAEYAPVKVQSGRLPTPRPLQTFAPHGSTLDGVVTMQQRIGRQPARPGPLRTMAVTPCERCGKNARTCPCPPAAPQTMQLVTQLVMQRQAAQEAAAAAAGYEPIRKTVGMSV